MKSAKALVAVMLACTIGNPIALEAGGLKCVKPCPESSTVVTAPASKVIVDIPAPEIVFNQSSTGAHQRQHWGHLRQHVRTGISNFVPASANVQQGMSMMNVPVTMSSASFIPMGVSFAPTANFAQMQMSGFSVASAPTISFAPMQISGFGQSSGCTSGSGMDSSSLTDLVKLSIKAEELRARASTVLATAMKENLEVQQLAASVLSGSMAKGPTQAGITGAQTTQDLTAQVNQLAQQVERLTAMVERLSAGKR